ncbi:MAG TPA: site-specific integrase [Gemmatimonadaceae bacterium]|nr:site-specific integrase [Gemmatimonadaceae bacterium]
MLIHTGADVGEVLSRTVRDVTLDRPAVRVRYRRTKTRTPERFVPVPSDVAAELRGHIANYQLNPGDALFGIFTRGAVEWVHTRARAAIGRSDLRLKDFRHIAAIAWRKAGLDLQTIRDWLGHATINQTVVYSAYGPDDAREAPAAERAAELLTREVDVIPLRAAAAS